MAASCPVACHACPPPTVDVAVGWRGDVLSLTTEAGVVRFALHADLAPNTVSYIKRLASSPDGCPSCRLYRAEAVPQPGAVDNFGGPGPPYALVQGSFASPLFAPVEKEQSPLVERGDACLIGTGPDFFVAVAAHREWGHGHTVWGRVMDDASQAVVDAISTRPVKEEVWGQTHVTTLVTPLPFTLAVALATP